MQNFIKFIQVYWNIRWLRRLAITAACLLLILILIPVGIQYGISYLLKQQGASSAQVEDINLNLFAGTFELTNLTLQVTGYDSASIGRISTNLNMIDLVASKIVIDELYVQNVSANILKNPDGVISIGGLQLPTEQADETKTTKTTGDGEPLAFAVNKLALQKISISYQEPDFQQRLTVNDMTLSNIKSWEPDSTAELQAELSLDNAPLNVAAKLNLFDDSRKLKGQLSLTSLPFKPYAKFYRDYLSNLEGELTLTSEFDLTMNDQIMGQIENKLEIAGLDLQYQTIHQQIDQIVWQGQTKIQQDYQPEIRGQLEIVKSATTDSKQQYRLASFDQLNLASILYKADSVSLERIELENYTLNQQTEQQPFVNLGSVQIEGLAFKPQTQSLAIKQITLAKPSLQITLNEDKQLVQLTPILATIQSLAPAEKQSGTGNSAQPESSSATESAPNIQITKLTLSEPGQLDFTDLSVNPNYQSSLTFNTININNISSNEAADFKLELKHADYTVIDIQGSGLLLDPAQQLTLKADIKQLDLPPITSYTSTAMGYGMKSGVVDSSIDLKLIKREIDSLIDLKVDSIEVIETQPETSQQVTSASGMSIDLAVSTLKDDNNIIELQLPVKGNLDQPDFDLSLIMNKALGKAMQSASLSYLKHALQPFGSLITLFNLAKAAAEHISLPPVAFKPNSLEFEDNQQDLLEKVSKVLKERPELKIKACGVSSLADHQAIKEVLVKAESEKLKKEQQAEDGKEVAEKPEKEVEIFEKRVNQEMKKLADGRSAKVKAYFLKNSNLDSNRILNCLSATNLEKGSNPTVELQI